MFLPMFGLRGSFILFFFIVMVFVFVLFRLVVGYCSGCSVIFGAAVVSFCYARS